MCVLLTSQQIRYGFDCEEKTWRLNVGENMSRINGHTPYWRPNMTLIDPAWNLDDYTATPQHQEDPYTEADAYSAWIGEQPDGTDTSWEAWEEYKEVTR